MKPHEFVAPISRRVLLRCASRGVLALPLLDGFVASEAHAGNAPYPKRLVILFTPNGTVAENYFGSGDGASFQPGSIFQPLVEAGHKKDLLILDNVNDDVAMQPYGDAHGVGMGCLLTGKSLRPGEDFKTGMGAPGSGWADNESIDQTIAREIGTRTELASLELSGVRAPGNLWTRMSYRGPANPVAPIDDPRAAFERVFGRQRSVRDEALRELKQLNGRVSADDREKLGVHLAALEEVEQRFDDRTFPGIVRSQLDIIAGAIACDVTRVASLVFCPSRSDLVMSWAPLHFSESHHQVSHYGDDERDSKAKLTMMNQWYAGEIARFVTKLKSIQEGSGSVFDNTLVVWVNELGTGNSHSHARLPLALIGSAGGHFRTGRTVRFSTPRAHNDFLVSIANAMGVRLPNGNTFGDPAYCTGPLPGLTA